MLPVFDRPYHPVRPDPRHRLGIDEADLAWKGGQRVGKDRSHLRDAGQIACSAIDGRPGPRPRLNQARIDPADRVLLARRQPAQKAYTSEARVVVSVDTEPSGGSLSYWTLYDSCADSGPSSFAFSAVLVLIVEFTRWT